MSNSNNGPTQPVLGRRPRGPDDNKERLLQNDNNDADSSAYIAAAKRKDRSREGKIESAKKSSEAHYETHGRFFYLTEDIILSPGSFEELEEEEQILDPDLILPDGVTRQFALEDLRAKTEDLEFPQTLTIGTNGGGQRTSELMYNYPTFSTTENSVKDSPLTVSPADVSLQSSAVLDSSHEELDFDLYLKDPDEIVESGLGLAEQGRDASGSNYFNQVLDPASGWTDYVLDMEGFVGHGVIDSWTEGQKE